MAEQKREHLIVRRIINADAETVFAAFVDAESLRAWWCPRGYSASDATVDARVGGQYRLTMTPIDGDGPDVRITGVYRELDAPQRIVMTHTFEPGSGGQFESLGLIGHTTLLTIRFTEVRGQTEVVLIQEEVPPGALEMLEFGWAGILENLSTFASSN